MKYLLFTLLFIFLTNWQVVISVFKGSFFSKTKSLTHKNNWLFKVLKQKTGIEFKFRKIISDSYNGFMPIYPPNTIFLSSKIWADFNKDELQWVALHEAGHRVYRHGLRYIPISLGFIAFGILILYYHNNIISNWIVLAIILTPIYQQIVRQFENQADKYAAINMDNPMGMITANDKFKKVSRSLIYNNDLLRFLFTPHLSWEERKIVAETEIEKRKR